MTDPKDFEQDNQDLAESIISAYETIESAIEMTDFLDTLTSASPLDRILELTGDRLNSILPFDVSAFYLVNEETGELEVHSCCPAAESERIKGLIADEVDKGNVHIALRDQRPMLRHLDSDKSTRLLLHSISTTRRCRGLFAGLFSHGSGHGDRLSLLLLTLVLTHCANALESASLYEMVHRSNLALTGAMDKNRILFNKLSMGIDEILRLVRYMLKTDPSVSAEEKATRLTVLRASYRYFTQTGIPEEKNLREVLSTVVRHYSSTFALQEKALQLSITGSTLKISLLQGVLLSLTLFEILATAFHRRKETEWENIEIHASLDKIGLQIRTSPSRALADPEKSELGMLRFLVTKELGGALKVDPSDSMLRLHIPLR
ncbi:hypothetical protein [Marispirochaeta sp.]|uniref:hypothetical protein n=1 Tax=Marispirochaeta sp. TaxID=2038653 RepID=UPI0029C84BB5|nr:hypothetical protein [Marispirochaeta sp.]